MILDQIAYNAGFRKAGEMTTASQETNEVLGMELITTPIMPDGFIAIRDKEGATIIAPSGAIWRVPFYSMSCPECWSGEQEGE